MDNIRSTTNNDRSISSEENHQRFYEEEQLELAISHKEQHPDHHFKIGDIVSFKSLKNIEVINNDQLVSYKHSKDICPRKMLIDDIEYENFFGDIVQYLYFETRVNSNINIDNRQSIFFDYCREEKIKRILEEDDNEDS